MKLINTKKIIEKIIGEIDDLEGLDNDEEYQHGPCFGVRIDRDNNNIIFLINNEEKMKYPLSNIEESFITIDNISKLIFYLKNGDFTILKNKLDAGLK